MSSDEISNLIGLAVQIPQVIALIYLVIKLEEHRFKAIQARDEIHKHTIDALIGLIDELASRNHPDKLTANQLKNVLRYLAENKENGGRFPPSGE